MTELDSGYLKGKMKFGYNEYNLDSDIKTYLTSNENVQDFRESLILKNMELVFGVVPAHTIISFVSQHIGKSRSDILSNFETFSKYIIQVYGDVEGRKFLSKLPITK